MSIPKNRGRLRNGHRLLLNLGEGLGQFVEFLQDGLQGFFLRRLANNGLDNGLNNGQCCEVVAVVCGSLLTGRT